jgi:diguanylate cyclase (GGDEF)-like protein
MAHGHAADFRVRSTLGVAVTALVLLTPFAINNFAQGRYLLGVGSLGIVAMLGVSAWGSSRGRHYPLLTFVGLVPAIILFLMLAFRGQGVIGALWCYPAVVSLYFMLPERQAWAANVVLLGLAMPQAWDVLDPAVAVRVAATLAAVSIFAAIFVRVITSQQRRLEEQAVTDPLTGLFNRTLLAATLEQAVEQHGRTGAPMTLLALDLDHFKTINDTLGHDVGDDVLRSVGGLLRQRVRRADRVFRVGGEEFLVLLHATGAERGVGVAEELRSAVETLPAVAGRSVTTSIGVAALRSGERWKEWMKRADANMYRAKAAGRNGVMP